MKLLSLFLAIVLLCLAFNTAESCDFIGPVAHQELGTVSVPHNKNF